MNRNEFFAVAKITKAPIVVLQDGNKGYFIKMQSFNEDGTLDELTFMYRGEPRYFKSLSGIETTLKNKGLLSFSVKMNAIEVSARKRTKTEKQATSTQIKKTK